VERVDRRTGDLALVMLATLLVGFGFAMLYSASYPHARSLGKPAAYFVQRQGVWLAFGAAAAFLASWTPLAAIRAAVPPLLIASFVLLLLPFVPGLGSPVMGAQRWIFVGSLSFQPSELAKLTIVLYVSALLAKKRDRLDDAVNGILPPLIVVLVFSGLILAQNNFSTAVFLFLVALSIFFNANVRLVHLALIGSILLPLTLMLLFTREHRLQRIVAFLDPMRDPTGSSFQVLQARMALAAGGLWGRGLGLGTRKLGPLPEAHQDFIFAVVGEELGLLGALGVLFLFLLLAARGYSIAAAATDPFARYVAFGVTTTILFQALLNMAVVCGLAPATGVPLPFFSNGGSSLVVSLAMVGLLINVSRAAAQPRFGGLSDV
jgi:cell division protein FtsW